MVKKILSLLLLMMLAACSQDSTKLIPTDEMPDVGIPTESLNKNIYLRAPDEWNDFKTESFIRILVNVATEDAIIFPYNFGVRIFIFDNGWTEIENTGTYLSLDNITIAPGMDFLSGGIVTLMPDLDDYSQPVLLRVFVIGNILRDEKMTGEVVGSYITSDVELVGG